MISEGKQLTLEVDGHVWPLNHGDIIGRLGSVGGEILRKHDVLSRKHMQVSHESGRWWVTLLAGARNITLLNGKPLTAGAPELLSAVSDIKVDTLSLRLRIGQPSSTEAMPDHFPAGLVVLDEFLLVRWSNEFFRKMIGVCMQDGADFPSIFDATSGIHLRHSLLTLEANQDTGEMELCASACANWFSARFHREGDHYHGVLRDITNERRHNDQAQSAESRLSNHTDALGAILSAKAFRDGDLPAALPLLMERAASLLENAMASVWIAEPDTKLRLMASSDFARRHEVGRMVSPDGLAQLTGELVGTAVTALKKAGIASDSSCEALVLETQVQHPSENARCLLVLEHPTALGWTPAQRKLAALTLALLQQVFANAQRHRTLQRLETRESALAAELADAAHYIERRLPAPLTSGPVQIEWIYRPCGRLGGDMLCYEWLDSQHLALAVIDVMGHGSTASLHALSLAQTFKLLLARENVSSADPAAWLAALNAEFPMKEHQGLLWTMWCGLYNTSSRELHYASGGHPPALLLHKKSCKALSTDGPVLGAFDEAPFKSAGIRVPDGARLFLYTDGVYEFPTATEEAGTLEEFTAAVLGVEGMEHGTCAFLESRAAALCADTGFPDDFTIVCARFTR